MFHRLPYGFFFFLLRETNNTFTHIVALRGRWPNSMDHFKTIERRGDNSCQCVYNIYIYKRCVCVCVCGEGIEGVTRSRFYHYPVESIGEEDEKGKKEKDVRGGG